MSDPQEVPLSYELDGVIADYEHDYRFDDTSFETVQRVRDALVQREAELAALKQPLGRAGGNR